MTLLQVKNISKTYGSKQALASTTLQFAEGSFTAIVGRSGCGKTTLLRLLCGLEQPDSGIINLADGRKLGIMFQEPRLLPWLSVAENITLAAKHDASLDLARLPAILRILQLEEAQQLYPAQLSGGMAQRVALGRMLFYDADVLLLDEPFSALDYFTRQGLQQTLLELYEASHKTIVFVTHDVEEALLLADRVLVMEAGNVKREVAVKLPRPREAADGTLQQLRKQILDLLGK